MAQFQAYPPPIYGTLFYDYDTSGPSVITVTTQNVVVGITILTAGDLLGITADVADATADHLTIPTGGLGTYDIFYTINGHPSSASEDIEFGVYKDGTIMTGTSRVMSWAGNLNTVSVSGQLTDVLADSEELSLRFLNSTSNGDFTLKGAHLTIIRIAT